MGKKEEAYKLSWVASIRGWRMASGFQTLCWYLKRPSLYPALANHVSRRLFCKPSPLNDSRDAAISWCSACAVDTAAAIQQITGKQEWKRVADLFPDVLAASRQYADKCPVRMGGPGNLDLIYNLAEYCEAKKVIETGVAYGWSSLALLLSMKNRSGSRLISTDMPYANLDNDKYVGCVVPTELRSIWRILPYADRQALPKALKRLGAIDMCHYDSAKSYDARLWAYPKLWDALRCGGILISDDIGDNVAFRDFSASHGLKPIVVGWENKYIGIFIKDDT